MLAKWHNVDTPTGVKKVQGLGEKFVAEELVKHQIYWERPKSIKTPFGNSTHCAKQLKRLCKRLRLVTS